MCGGIYTASVYQTLSRSAADPITHPQLLQLLINHQLAHMIQSNLFTTTPLVPLKCAVTNYNQVVVVTRTFSTETIKSVPVMCVVVKRLML